jgi:fructosamine-3-kinase
MTDINTASRIVSKNIDPSLSIIEVKPLHGGMVNNVEKWITNGNPSSIVAKVSPEQNDNKLESEFRSMCWFRENTSFPIPEPYACLTVNEEQTGTYLLMEFINANNLGSARLTFNGMQRVQLQLADILIELHSHSRDTYGVPFKSSQKKRWLDIFGPQVEQNFIKSKSHLSQNSCIIIQKMLNNLEELMPEFSSPTLIHSDLWSTNIMIDDTDPVNPRIVSFIDLQGLFAEVEYELAYLQVFSTADQTFFDRYSNTFSLRDGFEDRCLIYWLNTMMLHVWHFGDAYLSSCENTAKQIQKII